MSNRDHLLLIYTCMCIILFLMIIILSFQSHQIRMLSAGLGMAWNRYGLSCIMTIKRKLILTFSPKKFKTEETKCFGNGL